MIVFIKHITIEGPGILGEYFTEKGYETSTIDLSLGDKLPESLDGIKAVIILGGPMNVCEEDKYSYLKDEDVFISKILDKEIPLLGICLGSQLLAKAKKAKVTKSSHEEIGFYPVFLEEEGKKDPIFFGIDDTFSVFQWHTDTFGVPEGGVLLATSKLCYNQAFRVGKNAYGFQFHLEVDTNIISSWVEEYFDCRNDALRQKSKKILDESKKTGQKVLENGYKIGANFENIINFC